jgi:hypothetical protein
MVVKPAAELRRQLLPAAVYHLQPLDLRLGSVCRSGRVGTLAECEERDWHSFLELDVGDELASFRTKGDGSCGLHGAWGHPSKNGDLVLREGQVNARREISNLVPGTVAAVRSMGRFGEDIVESLWNELAVPAATGNGHRESELFWNNLRRDQPELIDHVLCFLEQKKMMQKTGNAPVRGTR